MRAVLLELVALVAGLATWTWLEYAIHGWLAHRYRTFVTPLHWAHHVHAERVFTSPLAWVPVSVGIVAGSIACLGTPLGLAFAAGVVGGFFRYEYLHFRIHFREPRSRRERLRRAHHLAHHFRNARAYYGVSTPFWDYVFGTIPHEHLADYAAVEARPPLPGRSNLGVMVPPSRR